MGTNAAGLPYPDPTSLLANLDLDVKALADAVYQLPAAPALTPATGWTIVSTNVRKLGGVFVWLELVVQRAAGAATITAAASGGNITNADLTTMPAGWRPARTQYLATDQGASSLWRSQLTTAGLLALSHGAPGAAIAAGDNVTVSDLYALL